MLESRRSFLTQSLSAGTLLSLPINLWARSKDNRPRVAVIMTVFTYRSHAHVILENFLQPYLFNGEITDPGVDVVSFYVDQFPESDMARDVAEHYNIPIYDTIPKAMTLGGDHIAVDAVLSIGEHGDYPVNDLGQREYPRKRFFDEIALVAKGASNPIPIFNDKHLSYRWDWAKQMYDESQSLAMPMLAGSSVPLAQRIPEIEFESGQVIEEAVSIHGGGVESYDFHALEVLQSIVESRKGGETGVANVQFLSHDRLIELIEQQDSTRALLLAAMRAEMGEEMPGLGALLERSHGIRIEYADGLIGYAIKVLDSGIRWNFACRVEGISSPFAWRYYVGPWNNRNLFKALSRAIQTHFRDKTPPYPPERTLLVSGVLDAAMHSRNEEDAVRQTPELAFDYQATDFDRVREFGASWEIITESSAEPEGMQTDPFARRQR